MREYLEIGKIVSTHGLHGEFNVDLWCDSVKFAAQFSTMYLGAKFAPVKVLACRQNGFQAIIKSDCSDSLEDAKALVGNLLYFRRSDATLAEGCYFEDDLIGLTVTDSATGYEYGRITEVFRTGANDVYAFTDKNGRQQLFPAIRQVVDSVDISGGVIKITPPKGLFDDEN